MDKHVTIFEPIYDMQKQPSTPLLLRPRARTSKIREITEGIFGLLLGWDWGLGHGIQTEQDVPHNVLLGIEKAWQERQT